MDWTQTVDQLLDRGATAAVLILLTLAGIKGVYAAARWFGDYLVVPLRDRIVRHLESVDRHMTANTDCLNRHTELLGRHNELLERFSANESTQCATMEAIRTNLERQASLIHKISETQDEHTKLLRGER